MHISPAIQKNLIKSALFILFSLVYAIYHQQRYDEDEERNDSGTADYWN